MDFSIIEKKDNAAMGRQEISFSMGFDSAIPSRPQARQALSSAISIPSERIVVVKIEGKYGLHEVSGIAHVYANAEDAKKEKEYLLKRDGLVSAEKKAEKPAEKKAEKPAEKKAEKPAEKKEEKPAEKN